MKAKSGLIGLILGITLLIQGCGGGSGGAGAVFTGGTAPTPKTKADTEQHISGSGVGLVANSFTPFGPNSHAPKTPTSGGPFYDKSLGLWVVVTVTLTSFTETFYQDQAETEPAGSASYTLDIATQMMSGAINVTQGNYAGLSGTFSETISGGSLKGNYSLTLPSGTTITGQFSVSEGSNGNPMGTMTQTITESGGYSESTSVTYNSDGSIKITATDSNAYSSTLNFAADLSGTGTVTGPDPGLPATLTWDSSGDGTVTFANGVTVNFTNWKFPKPPAK